MSNLFLYNRTHLLSLLILLLAVTGDAYAHASEQAFVLLLPTGLYISSGVLAVVLTIVLLAFLPANASHSLLSAVGIARTSSPESVDGKDANVALDATSQRFALGDLISIAATLFLVMLLYLGLFGSRDPLENPLPLFIWTMWWIGFVVLQGVFGNLWHFLNPWTGLYRLLQQSSFRTLKSNRPLFELPNSIGVWPGVMGLVLFMLFALGDIAPDAPARLAVFVGAYWLYIFAGMCFFGEAWRHQADCFTILLDRYAQLAFFNTASTRNPDAAALETFNSNAVAESDTHTNLKVGFPGWAALHRPATTISGAVFILVLLGTGSFDGFNETFYWLHLIGINPLEFPGRSAVVVQTSIGLLLANVVLIAIYGICIYFGLMMANRGHEGAGRVGFRVGFCHLAIAILPIAFAYHFAHFLTAFLVNAQYALAAASDPLDSGADLLNLGTFYVTTGFMNSHHTVEAIWLTQAVAVVFGHVLSVLLAHALALDLFGSARRAIISQVPLAAFMVVYTFIGLWLLAAPRGA